MTLRVGIIGCGGIAQFHAKSWQTVPDAKIVSCADIIPERAVEYAEKYGIDKHYDSAEKLLDAGGLDVVSVCTPNYAHAQPTIAAFEAGLNVLCEKPMAMNVDEARSMLAARDKSKKLLTIGHNSRFMPACSHLKGLIEAGELGDLYHAKAVCLRRRGMPGWGKFHIKSASGGGPLIDVGVHALDLTMWLLGSPEPLAASGVAYRKIANREDYWNPWGNDYKREDYDVEDYASGMIRLAGGITLQVEASFVAHIPKNEYYQQFLGVQGGAVLRPFPETTESAIVKYSNSGQSAQDSAYHAFPETDSYAEECKYFAEAIRGEHDVMVKPEETLRVQKILDSVYLSAEKGCEIDITKQFGKDAWTRK